MASRRVARVRRRLAIPYRMFSFFKKKPPAAAPADTPPEPSPVPVLPVEPPRSGWLGRLSQGLRKTGSGIAQVFTGTRIDEAL